MFPHAVNGDEVSLPQLADALLAARGGAAGSTAAEEAYSSEPTPSSRRGLSTLELAPLVRLVWPWVAASCPVVEGTYGWEFRNLSLVEAARWQVRHRWVAGGDGCRVAPRAALQMSAEALLRFSRKCRRHSFGFLHYADHTVPLFQLALWLQLFRRSTWVFVRHEDLFDSRRPRALTVAWLARLFGLADPTANGPVQFAATAGCSWRRTPSARQPLEYVGGDWRAGDRLAEDAELRELFAPWQVALEELIQKHGHRIEPPP